MAAVTVLANARAWYDPASGTALWTAHSAHDTGTALYAVVQDTGATPKVRVLKADSRTAPSAFTEQDSANNKAITNVAFPFSSWYDATTGYIHVVVFTATNTITHYRFNTATDLWGTGFGAVVTAAENEHSIRVVVRSDGDTLVFFTSSADDADLGWARYEGVSWTAAATGIFSANNTGASSILDAGIDSTDRAWVAFYDVANVDIKYLTIDSANTVATAVLVDTNAPTAGSQQSGSRFNLYDDAGTDKIEAPYVNSGGTVASKVITLESDAAAGNVALVSTLATPNTTVGARTPTATEKFLTTLYGAWWDDDSGGTIRFRTKTGAVNWSAATAWKTGVSRIVDLLSVGTDGLAAVYQSDDTTLAFDWVVAPAGGPTNHPLAGTTSGIGASSGAVAVAKPLAGTSGGTGGQTGAVAVAKPLAGTSAGTGDQSGSAVVAKALAATSGGIGAQSGALDAAKSVAGTTAGSGDQSGALIRAIPVAGSASGTGDAAGDLTVTTGGVEHALVGTSSGTGDQTGDVAVAKSVAGATDGTGGQSGDLVRSAALAGTIPGVGDATGAIVAAKPLAGTSAGIGGATGDLDIAGTVSLVGTAGGTGDASGALAVARPLAGTGTGTGDQVGTLSAARSLAASSTGLGNATGDLSVDAGIVGTGSIFYGDLTVSVARAILTVTDAGLTLDALGARANIEVEEFEGTIAAAVSTATLTLIGD